MEFFLKFCGCSDDKQKNTKITNQKETASKFTNSISNAAKNENSNNKIKSNTNSKIEENKLDHNLNQEIPPITIKDIPKYQFSQISTNKNDKKNIYTINNTSYEIKRNKESVIGRSGNSYVYKGTNQNHKYAIKVIKSIKMSPNINDIKDITDEDILRKINFPLNEYNVSKKFNHKNILKYYDIAYSIKKVKDDDKVKDDKVKDDDIEWNELSIILVSKFIKGANLFDQAKSNKYSDQELKIILKDIFSSIQHLKEKGCVNLDIKPDNMIFTNNHKNNDPHCVTIDIDMVLNIEQLKESQHYFCGTPDYVSPDVVVLLKKETFYTYNMMKKSINYSLGKTIQHLIIKENFNQEFAIQDPFKYHISNMQELIKFIHNDKNSDIQKTFIKIAMVLMVSDIDTEYAKDNPKHINEIEIAKNDLIKYNIIDKNEKLPIEDFSKIIAFLDKM